MISQSKNSYPLPLVSDVLNHLQDSEWFSVLDLQWGFNNVCISIREGDEWKAAFHTNRGLYEPLVMFFRLCNSPATFQGMMNDILQSGGVFLKALPSPLRSSLTTGISLTSVSHRSSIDAKPAGPLT